MQMKSVIYRFAVTYIKEETQGIPHDTGGDIIYVFYMALAFIIFVFTAFTVRANSKGFAKTRFLMQAALLIYHTFLISTNQTTWEYTRRDNISYLRIYPKGTYPFSQGIFKNFYLVLCDKNIKYYVIICRW